MFSSHIEKVSPLVKKPRKCKVVIDTLFDLMNFLGQDPRPFRKHVKHHNLSFHLKEVLK